MKKLPIGIQSFEKLRKGGYYYVDKTHFIAKMVEEGTYYFLSRPRRFGKSLFLDTLKQAFLGKRELFEGLYLEKNWDWDTSYPVIHIDFGARNLAPMKVNYLQQWILEQLELVQETLGVGCKRKHDYAAFLEELVRKAFEKYQQRVVVLVDEYDKPILDKIEYKQQAEQVREILKNFYTVLKPLDYYLKFVFLTGVSKFSKVSIFSGLNQLNDISLDKAYATVCGYTQEELETVFAEALKGENLEDIRQWYNGYSWGGEPVYNPFDVLLYLNKREFRPYWFETGTPNFLVKLMAERGFYLPTMEQIIATERLVGSFEIDQIRPENLLFQAGYLTVKKCEASIRGMKYHLGYPNREVKIALNDYLSAYLTQLGNRRENLSWSLEDCLKTANLEQFKTILQSLFASIPYEWYRKNQLANYEGYYASVVYSFLAGAGFDLIAEDYTSYGRIDLTILYCKKAYILEFKVVEMEGENPKAIEQLRERQYHHKYKDKQETYLVGIDFSRESRNITVFLWEFHEVVVQ